jgi:hypothetical protein
MSTAIAHSAPPTSRKRPNATEDEPDLKDDAEQVLRYLPTRRRTGRNIFEYQKMEQAILDGTLGGNQSNPAHSGPPQEPVVFLATLPHVISKDRRVIQGRATQAHARSQAQNPAMARPNWTPPVNNLNTKFSLVRVPEPASSLATQP